MQAHQCLNCNHTLATTDKYCSNCSQTAHTHRFTFGHLMHEVFHAFTHADKGILLLAKGLLTQPYIVV